VNASLCSAREVVKEGKTSKNAGQWSIIKGYWAVCCNLQEMDSSHRECQQPEGNAKPETLFPQQ